MGKKRYSVPIMDDRIKLLNTNVDEFLKSTPNAARFFLEWHSACMGCGFARFCSIADVITIYHLDEAAFLEKVSTLKSKLTPKGESK